MKSGNQRHAAQTPEDAVMLGQRILHILNSDQQDVTECFSLIEKGADLTQKDKNSGTAVVRAAQGGRAPVLKALLDAGADPDTPAANGISALMWATLKKNDICARFLLKADADINAQDNDGWTALIYAVDMKDPKAVQFLLDHGADPTIPDRHGATPLKTAQLLSPEYKKRDALIEILTEADHNWRKKKELEEGLKAIDSTAHNGTPHAMTAPPVPPLPKRPLGTQKGPGA